MPLCSNHGQNEAYYQGPYNPKLIDMKSTHWFTILLIGIVSAGISCKQNADSPLATTTAVDSPFVARPVAVPKQDVKTLEIGQTAPDFRLPDVNGKYVSLGDFNKSDVLVIIFHCNHCPTAQAYEDRMIAFTNDYKDKSVAMVAIMPNSAMGLLPEECGYTDLNDSFEEMKIRSEHMKYNFPTYTMGTRSQ